MSELIDKPLEREWLQAVLLRLHASGGQTVETIHPDHVDGEDFFIDVDLTLNGVEVKFSSIISMMVDHMEYVVNAHKEDLIPTYIGILRNKMDEAIEKFEDDLSDIVAKIESES